MDSYQVIYTLNTDESRYPSDLGWTKSKIHLEYNKYPEPPEGIEKLDEMPEQIIGKIKPSPDRKKDWDKCLDEAEKIVKKKPTRPKKSPEVKTVHIGSAQLRAYF